MFPTTKLKWIDWRLFLMPVIGVLVWLLWLRTAEAGTYPAYILPHPADVWDRFIALYESGNLQVHIATTMREALTGLFIAGSLAVVVGYIIARIRIMDYLLTPYLIFLQAIPIIAISPLIIIWFGTGITSKVIIAGLITWFPMLVATIIGIRSTSSDLRDLMRANVASPWQVFWHLELPSALPEILGGLKIATTLSIIGAAVGEFVSPNAGLGYLVVFGRSTSDTPLVIVAVFLLTIISLILYGLISWLEQTLLSWQRLSHS